MALSDYITSTQDWENETTRHIFDVDGTTYFIDDVCGTLKLLLDKPVEWIRPMHTLIVKKRGAEVDMNDPKNGVIAMRCIESLIKLGHVNADAHTHKKQREALWIQTRG